MKYKCPFGIESSQLSIKNFEDGWEVILDGGEEAYFQTKETFLHEEENLTFEYKYVIQLAGVVDDESDDVHFFSNLFLVPLIKYIHPDIVTKIMKFCGREKAEDITVDEIIFETCCPTLCHETPNFKRQKSDDFYGWDWIEIKKVQNYLRKAYESIKLINSIRGFYLDKHENLLGNTGWDFLKELLFNADSTQLALDRYDKYIKERKLV